MTRLANSIPGLTLSEINDQLQILEHIATNTPGGLNAGDLKRKEKLEQRKQLLAEQQQQGPFAVTKSPTEEAVARLLKNGDEIFEDWECFVQELHEPGDTEFDKAVQAKTDWQTLRPLLAAAPAMHEDLQAGIKAAQLVIDNWSQGDLAAAVNGLEHWLTGARVTLAKAGAQ